jgi:hypothetical protein
MESLQHFTFCLLVCERARQLDGARSTPAATCLLESRAFFCRASRIASPFGQELGKPSRHAYNSIDQVAYNIQYRRVQVTPNRVHGPAVDIQVATLVQQLTESLERLENRLESDPASASPEPGSVRAHLTARYI